MLQELFRIFRSGDPLHNMGEEFAEMLELTREMTVNAGQLYFGEPVAPETRSRIYKTDVRVNKLERSIRKQVVAHLSHGHATSDVPYCLLLMSLVKDVERIGDYAKNLTEVDDFYAGDFPEDELVAELQQIRTAIETTFRSAAQVFVQADPDRARPLVLEGRKDAKRADTLVQRLARSGYDPALTTALVLGTRFYKRIGGHLINVLSSAIMPLHKIDYYDEDEVPPNVG